MNVATRIFTNRVINSLVFGKLASQIHALVVPRVVRVDLGLLGNPSSP